ncbi:hypothetical protein Tco_0268541 [Tanacetum coccineum]
MYMYACWNGNEGSQIRPPYHDFSLMDILPVKSTRCSSPPSMNISHDDFELTVAETPNYNEPLTVKKEPINEAYYTTVESVSELLFYFDRLEIQHIEASMNSKCILYAANARLNAGSSNLPPQNVVSSSSALANSPAFVRPSRTLTSTRFGSALNIEALVDAAENRETPIDETIKGLGPGCIFTLTAIAKWECSSYGRTLELHARGTGPHKGVKASANSDVMYSFTSAQDGDPLQDDVRLCLGDDLKKAQDHSQRQAGDLP